MRSLVKIYRNKSYSWPSSASVPARSLDMTVISEGNADLAAEIREPALADVFGRFAREGRHGVFAMIDGAPAGHAWITAPAASDRVVNSYARLEAGDCLIHYCFVDPARRGRGIYAEMLHEVTAWAIASGARRVLVDTGRDNIASQRGIQRAGFQDHQDTIDVVVARKLIWSRHSPAARSLRNES